MYIHITYINLAAGNGSVSHLHKEQGTHNYYIITLNLIQCSFYSSDVLVKLNSGCFMNKKSVIYEKFIFFANINDQSAIVTISQFTKG